MSEFDELGGHSELAGISTVMIERALPYSQVRLELYAGLVEWAEARLRRSLEDMDPQSHIYVKDILADARIKAGTIAGAIAVYKHVLGNR